MKMMGRLQAARPFSARQIMAPSQSLADHTGSGGGACRCFDPGSQCAGARETSNDFLQSERAAPPSIPRGVGRSSPGARDKSQPLDLMHAGLRGIYSRRGCWAGGRGRGIYGQCECSAEGEINGC